jgi:hypothetical protein
MIWPRLVIPFLISLVGGILLLQDRKRLRAARKAPGGLDPRIELAERWRRIGGWMIAVCVVPLWLAVVTEAPPAIVNTVLTIGAAGALILLVSSFVSGWLSG